MLFPLLPATSAARGQRRGRGTPARCPGLPPEHIWAPQVGDTQLVFVTPSALPSGVPGTRFGVWGLRQQGLFSLLLVPSL